MGYFATFAIVVCLIYYTATRSTLKLMRDAVGPDVPKTQTNFHEEKSLARPEGGKYYQPIYKIF
jgi:hypothetical protein